MALRNGAVEYGLKTSALVFLLAMRGAWFMKENQTNVITTRGRGVHILLQTMGRTGRRMQSRTRKRYAP